MPVDFAQLMADLAKFQAGMTTIQGQLTRPVEKDLLGAVLGELQKARAELETNLPQALAAFEKQRAQNQADIQAVKARLAERSKQTKKPETPPAANKPAEPAPAKPSEPKPDPALGAKLKLELFQRFKGLPTPPTPQVVDEGSVAEHWAGGEEAKTAKPAKAPEVADEWPEELRTPSSKKTSTKKLTKPPSAKPPSKPPADDDESIGKSWGEEDK